MSDIPSKQFGLAANGRAGPFYIEIDEAIEGRDEFWISITTATWSFRFSLSARTEPARMLLFLNEHAGKTIFSEAVIGSFFGGPVLLIKDDDRADRFWLRASAAVQSVEFVLAGDEIVAFTDALAQVVEQLKS